MSAATTTLQAGSAANLSSALRHWSERDPGREFLAFCPFDGEPARWTFGDFHEAVRRVGAGLQDIGLRPGDRCVIHLENSVGFLLAFWACQEIAAVAVPTVVSSAADELGFVIDHCDPACVVVAAEQLAKVRAACSDVNRQPEIVLDLPADGAGVPSLEELRTDPGPGVRSAGSSGDLAAILYTSGTTSRPKGAMLTHAGSLHAGETFAQHLRIRPEDRVLTCLPLFHVNGLYLQMLPAVLAGAGFVLTPRFSVSRYWQWVRELDVTVAHLVAGPIRLLAEGKPSPADRAHVLRVMTFGLPLDDEEIAAFEERFGVPLSMGWGLTESSCGGTHMPLYAGRHPGRQAIGRAELGWDVRVVDDDGEELPRRVTGELVIRSPGVMKGYYRDPEATRAALRDGWLLSGDLGYEDEEGYFHFVDRKKDMIKTDGENVAAGEVERVIGSHDAVAECAVVGVPHRIRGEVGRAYVVLAPGWTLDTADLLEFCHAHLARFKVPEQVEFRDELPKTSIGKIRKGELAR